MISNEVWTFVTSNADPPYGFPFVNVDKEQICIISEVSSASVQTADRQKNVSTPKVQEILESDRQRKSGILFANDRRLQRHLVNSLFLVHQRRFGEETAGQLWWFYILLFNSLGKNSCEYWIGFDLQNKILKRNLHFKSLNVRMCISTDFIIDSTSKFIYRQNERIVATNSQFFYFYAPTVPSGPLFHNIKWI